jgi:hypothetical protein
MTCATSGSGVARSGGQRSGSAVRCGGERCHQELGASAVAASAGIREKHAPRVGAASGDSGAHSYQAPPVVRGRSAGYTTTVQTGLSVVSAGLVAARERALPLRHRIERVHGRATVRSACHSILRSSCEHLSRSGPACVGMP